MVEVGTIVRLDIIEGDPFQGLNGRVGEVLAVWPQSELVTVRLTMNWEEVLDIYKRSYNEWNQDVALEMAQVKWQMRSRFDDGLEWNIWEWQVEPFPKLPV